MPAPSVSWGEAAGRRFEYEALQPPPPMAAVTSATAPRATTSTSVACWLEVTSQRIALAAGAIAVTLRSASAGVPELPSRSFSAASPEPSA